MTTTTIPMHPLRRRTDRRHPATALRACFVLCLADLALIALAFWRALA